MAAFDAELDAQIPNAIPIPDPNRMAFLENQFQYLYAEVTHLRGVVNQPPPPPLNNNHSVLTSISLPPLTSLASFLNFLCSN